jgi:hypothetical protein
MSWQNAPTLNKLTASQQGGNRGAQLWGVDFSGKLHTIYQVTPGGEWSKWLGPDWAGPGYPKQVYELAAAQQNDGRVQLWVLDMKQQLWSIWQTSPGGNWSGWSGPNWNNAPKGMKKIAASQQGGNRGAQLWGIKSDYSIATSYQLTPGGNWSGWQGWPPTHQHSQWIEMTACQQGDGRVAFWAIDTKRQLWGMGQHSPGGDWGPWSGPNWLGVEPLNNVAACQQGGKLGAVIWGLTENYQVISNHQVAPGGGWGGWQSGGDWFNAPKSYEITAAQQNNGCIQVWAISLKQVLTSIAQTGTNCAWGMSWQPREPRPPKS